MVCLVGICGCSQIQIPFFGKSAEEAKTIPVKEELQLEVNEFIDRGRIVDTSTLKQSKSIAIIPFKAGVNAEANIELDRTALMIIKGITDAFADDKTGKHDHFNVLMADEANDADLVISGYISDMSKPSKWKRWVMLNSKRALGVKGKMVDSRTGDAVLTFEEFEHAGSNSEDFKILGHRVGVNLGRYILSGLE